MMLKFKVMEWKLLKEESMHKGEANKREECSFRSKVVYP